MQRLHLSIHNLTHLVRVSLGGLRLQCVVVFAGDEDEPPHRIAGAHSRVVEHGLELCALAHFGEAGDGLGQSNEELGADADEWLAEWQEHLASEQVEVVGRRGWIGYEHVDRV